MIVAFISLNIFYFFIQDRISDPCPPHPISTYNCGMTIAPMILAFISLNMKFDNYGNY